MVRTAPGAVLWDMDGVLVDTESLLFECERRAFAEQGVEITEEFKKGFVGLGGFEVLGAMADALGVDVDLERIGTRKIETFWELLPTIQPFAPTSALVRALAEHGVPQAVASGSPRAAIDACLATAGLADIIAVRVTSQEVAAGKPAPDVFLLAAERLGVPAGTCVVVEDAVPGLRAAQAAGMRCLAIPWVTDPLDPHFETADRLVRDGMRAADPDALLPWLLGRAD